MMIRLASFLGLAVSLVACVAAGPDDDLGTDDVGSDTGSGSDSGSGSGSGTMDPPPPSTPVTYEVSKTAGGCETLPFDSTSHEIRNFVHATEAFDLPFAFPFYEDQMTRIAAIDRGQLLLFSGSSTSITFADPTDIPSGSSPNGYIAPFWTSHLQSYLRGTIETAMVDGHLVVQWNDFFLTTIAPDSTSHVTMQVRLFPDGTIETAYCQLVAAGSNAGEETGSKATVGIEAPDGVRGTRFSYRTADSINTGMGLRFVRR